MIVLAIQQRKREQFIDGHDLRVAQRGGKQVAEVTHRRLEALAGFALFRDENRSPVGNCSLVRADVDVLKLHMELGGQQSGPGVGRAGHHIRLHAAFDARFRFERSRCHQFATRQLGGNAQRDRRRGTHTDRGHVDCFAISRQPAA